MPVIIHRTSPGVDIPVIDYKDIEGFSGYSGFSGDPYGYYLARKKMMRYRIKTTKGYRPMNISCATCKNLVYVIIWGRGHYKCTFLGISRSKATTVGLKGRCKKYVSRKKLSQWFEEHAKKATSRRLYTDSQEYKDINKKYFEAKEKEAKLAMSKKESNK